MEKCTMSILRKSKRGRQLMPIDATLPPANSYLVTRWQKGHSALPITVKGILRNRLSGH